jgi:hypothetical protein
MRALWPKNPTPRGTVGTWLRIPPCGGLGLGVASIILEGMKVGRSGLLVPLFDHDRAFGPGDPDPMAKMFYSAEEAAGKLGKSVDELMDMAKSGELQSFKQDNADMFRVEQIDMMISSTDDTDDIGDLSINLDDSGEADSLGLSGSAPGIDGDEVSLEMSGEIGLEDSNTAGADDSFLAGSGMGTGISAFESEASGDDLLNDDLSLETVGSGSGLLDLTRESDDTSLGAELLDEVYSNDDDPAIPASSSGLFEAAGAESGGNNLGGGMPIGGVPMIIETYDGGWSGLGVGMGIVAVASLCLVALMAFVGASGTLPALAEMMTSSMMIWFGGLVGGLIIFGLLGFFIGKASE